MSGQGKTKHIYIFKMLLPAQKLSGKEDITYAIFCNTREHVRQK